MVTDEHETELERAPEPALATEAEVTRRVLYHNTGVDDDGELERAVSPPPDAVVEQSSFHTRKDADGSGSGGEPVVEDKLEISTDTNAGVADVDIPGGQDDEIALPHPTRPIPLPPADFDSKPASPSRPPNTVLQILKDDEDDRAASPDIPPRPIPPPPVRSGTYVG